MQRGEWSYGSPQIKRFATGEALIVGKFCSIADGAVFLLGADHNPNFISTFPFATFFPGAQGQPSHIRIRGDIVVGNDVWIGHGATILGGVRIWDGAIIGAGAVVTKDVDAYSVVAGNPARHIRYRIDPELIPSMVDIAWWDWPPAKINDAVPMLMSNNVREFVEKYK